jgi:hypothetical protein
VQAKAPHNRHHPPGLRFSAATRSLVIKVVITAKRRTADPTFGAEKVSGFRF